MTRFLICLSLFIAAISNAHGALDSYVLSGTWYVLAESQDLDAARCACTALELGDADGDTHHVRLSCQRGGGFALHLSGTIQVLESATSERLRLFFPLMGATIGTIVASDADYHYLVVVDQAGGRALVLSRTRELSPDQLQQALAALKQHAPLIAISQVAQAGC